MNIFILDNNPRQAARYLIDKHVIKMILESAQMLCSPFVNGEAPYRRTHYNHPCSKWVRESKENYEWLIEHAIEMCNEYSRRYNKIHKSSEIIYWCRNNYYKLNLPSKGLLEFAQAMPEEYKVAGDAVKAYRNYYIGEKAKFATWKHGCVPYWWPK